MADSAFFKGFAGPKRSTSQMNQGSDRDLILAYQRGKEAAFTAFYDRHAAALYVFVLAFVRRREVAEDLVQETFGRLLRSLGSLETREDMGPFLFQAARRLAIDWHRREMRGRTALESRSRDPFFRAEPVSCSRDGAVVDAEDLSYQLHELPDPQREAVVLRDLAGMKFIDIAAVVEVPEATVVSRYRAGIEKLRRALLATARRRDRDS